MYRWYEKSKVCYAYLEDVEEDYEEDFDDADEDSGEKTSNDSIDGNNYFFKSVKEITEISFRLSRWFTRGWTLQELIAPSQFNFFSKKLVLSWRKVRR